MKHHYLTLVSVFQPQISNAKVFHTILNDYDHPRLVVVALWAADFVFAMDSVASKLASVPRWCVFLCFVFLCRAILDFRGYDDQR